MPQATDKKIEKLFRGDEMQGQYGPYRWLSIYFEGSNNKFSIIEKSKERNPVIGDVVDLVFISETSVSQKDGKTYTNRKITSLEYLNEASKSTTESQTGTVAAPEGQGNGRAYLDHGKVVLALLEMAGGVKAKEADFLHLVDLFWKGVQVILDASQGSKAPPEKGKITNDNPPDNKPEWEQGDPEPAEDDIPF